MAPNTDDLRIRSLDALTAPAELLRELPCGEALSETVADARRSLHDILHGRDDRLAVVIGPCSIHDPQAALEYARRLAPMRTALGDALEIVMRVYFEKPRTTVGWKGLINDPLLDGSFNINAGLRLARELLRDINALGLPAGCEYLDVISPQYIADLVAWGAIGARTTESQVHREMASGLSCPVGFKNGTDGNPQIAVDAMISARSPHGFIGLDHEGRTALVRTTGNPDGHLVLRGDNQGPNFDAGAIADAKKRLEAGGVRPQLLVDCSHGNSSKDHTKQAAAFKDVIEQRVAGDTNIIGCMLESNLQPGNQKLVADLALLKYGISITDACIGWDETEDLLHWAHEKTAAAAKAPVG